MSFRLPRMGLRQLWHRLTEEFSGLQANQVSERSIADQSGKRPRNPASIISADWCKSSVLGENGCILHITVRESETHFPVEPRLKKTIQY